MKGDDTVRQMTDAQFWGGMAVLVGALAALAAGFILHWRCLMLDELRQRKRALDAWADREAQRRALYMLKHATITIKPVLINESDENWGDPK